MLYVAGSKCYKLPGRLPAPLFHTNYKCGRCRGHLHGVCGTTKPELDHDLKRVYGVCARHNPIKASIER